MKLAQFTGCTHTAAEFMMLMEGRKAMIPATPVLNATTEPANMSFLRLLCCPACHGDLSRTDNGDELRCVRCRFDFPIVDGIPVMFPCDVKQKMKELFQRYWDTEERAHVYDTAVEGGDDTFGVFNHQCEMYGLTVLYDPTKLSLVLDAGCGNGRFLEALPASSVRIGIDASLNLLRHTRQKGRGDFLVCGELEHLPFKDEVFDTVISCRVLQHLRQQELAVQEVCRVVRRDGDVILELYNTLNLKTIYKNIRMSRYAVYLNAPFRWVFRSMSPFAAWGLEYDKYNNWFQVRRWLAARGMAEVTGRGVGFGYHKYFFQPFYVSAVFAQKAPGLFKRYLDACSAFEKRWGASIPFRWTLEKFVIKTTKRGGVHRDTWTRVLGKLDHAVRASILFNSRALREGWRERRAAGVVVRDHRFHFEHAISWLERAQDSFPDGGVARGYSLGWNFFFGATGWQPSYPETTGYIIPTFFDAAEYLGEPRLRARAFRMADWEIEVQLAQGAVMSGTIGSAPTPAVFNTGQVILGWLRAYNEGHDEKHMVAAVRAGNYLLEVQDPDGSWQRGNSAFANSMATTYNSRVGWALLMLGDQIGDARYRDAGRRNIEYTLSQQNENGWFRNNCLTNPNQPLLHTICYALEGVLGAYEKLRESVHLESVVRGVEPLLTQVSSSGRLPGRWNAAWRPTCTWDCLTGSAQFAGILLRLFAITGEKRFQARARRILAFLKSTQNCLTAEAGLRGGIKGSYPIGGEYGRYELLNWATKFFVDALLLDEKLLTGTS
jgi:ubiquinone/menaquinone biosynthesis C-methylase UbiE/uncharacterized protein YbaR (Trm112 family)